MLGLEVTDIIVDFAPIIDSMLKLPKIGFVDMNIPKVIKYCPKCKTHTEQKVPFTRLEKDEVLQEVNVDMLNVKKDMVDKNSQN